MKPSLALALLAFAACHPQDINGMPRPAPIINTDPLGAKIDALADDMIRQHLTVGLSIAVAHHGTIDWAKGYGTADVAGQRPATPETVYRIGSLTKQFTAAAIVQLAEAGKLKLTDDISRYVPGVATAGNHVTIEQLLHHTSGIPNYTDQPSFAKLMTQHLAPADIVASVKDVAWDFPPGTKWLYSNTGYVVLGMIIEQVSGEPYARYLAHHVFPAAGLVSTSYCDETVPDPRRALGYTVVNGATALASPVDLSTPFSAGAICSTVLDLLRWDAALAGGRVVSPAGYVAMTTSHALPDHAYGFGLELGAFKGHRFVAHNGGINGFVSELHDYPDDGVTIAVLTNTESPVATALEREVALLELGVPSAAVAISAAELAAYAGVYTVAPLGDVVIAVDGDHLVITPAHQPTLPLEYRGNGAFALEVVGATVTFERDAATNAVTGIAIHQGSHDATGKRKP